LGQRCKEAGGEDDDGQPEQVFPDDVRTGGEDWPGCGEQGNRDEAAESECQ